MREEVEVWSAEKEPQRGKSKRFMVVSGVAIMFFALLIGGYFFFRPQEQEGERIEVLLTEDERRVNEELSRLDAARKVVEQWYATRGEKLFVPANISEEERQELYLKELEKAKQTREWKQTIPYKPGETEEERQERLLHALDAARTGQ